MKNCYFFKGSDCLYIQTKKDPENPIILSDNEYSITNDKDNNILYIKDEINKKYYYPISNCKKIQY
jgi:c-di-AMP phosphodiesterase-like protein